MITEPVKTFSRKFMGYDAAAQRIEILEQLMGVYRDLERVPAALESAYEEQKNPAEEGLVTPVDDKVRAG